MNIDTNDPRLTAYALGELEGPDRDAVEAALAGDDEARRHVEEVREVARLLGESFRQEQEHEQAPALTADQRVAIEATLVETPAGQPTGTGAPPVAGSLPTHKQWHNTLALFVLAACLLFGSAILLIPAKNSGRMTGTLAMRDPSPAGSYADDRFGRPATVRERTSGNVFAPSNTPQASAAAASRPLSEVTTYNGAEAQVRLGKAVSAPAAPGMMGGTPGSSAGMSGMGRSVGMGGPVSADRGQAQRPQLGLRYYQVGQGQQGQQGQGEPGQQGQPGQGNQQPAQQGQALPGLSDTRRSLVRRKSAADAFSVETSVGRTPSSAPARSGESRDAQGATVGLSVAEKPAAVPGTKAKENEAKQQGGPANDELAALQLSDNDKKLAETASPAATPPAEPEPQVEAVPAPDNEVFDNHPDNRFLSVTAEPLSTFSIDVDTAGYANVRRFLNQNTLPPTDAVRIEELVNYFPYSDPAPTGDDPLAIHAEIAACPWNPDHRLARVALTSKAIPAEGRPLSNLVFLIDVSGSMNQPNKLPLVKASLHRLVGELGENDRVGIVVYAGASGLALPSTSCMRKAEILSAIDQLEAGGSTNGGAGIQLAYDEAVRHFIKGGANRVILATDGDFNVGVTSRGDLIRLIEAKRQSGVFLSVLGFGMGNLKDSQLEQLANKGNGHYAYIDSLKEAEKVLIEEMGATLNTVAKDVKFQIEFNPAKVGAYRLIGYENRLLANQDFADDAKDAGEIGAGHHVTALYELAPPGKEAAVAPKAEPLAFQKPVETVPSPDTMVIKLRYKRPDQSESRLYEKRVGDRGTDFARASDDFKFAASVAGFGMLLRNSPYRGSLTYPGVLELASGSLADDPSGYRKEFVELVRKAQSLTPAR